MSCSFPQENETWTKLQPESAVCYKNLIEAYKSVLEPSYLYIER